jgi:hypothetical protein
MVLFISFIRFVVIETNDVTENLYPIELYM